MIGLTTQYSATATIAAFDGSLSAIRRASASYDGIEFVVADAYNPPYSPDYFDCIVCNNIWEHVADPLRLLETIGRSLKPDGYLLISTPSRYRLNNLLRVIVGKSPVLASPHHVTEYSVGQVHEQLRHAGFAVYRMGGRLLHPETITFRSLLKASLGSLCGAFIKLTGSHHSLAPTTFYLAKRSAVS